MRALPEGWQFQYRRMMRSFAKLRLSQSNPEEHDDNLYHFLQDAWHLKDWIKNDPEVSEKIRKEIENDVQVDAFMKTEALANATKHLGLNNRRRNRKRKWNWPWTGARVTERKSTILDPSLFSPTSPFPPGYLSTLEDEEQDEGRQLMSVMEQERVVTWSDGSTTTAEKVAEDVMREWDKLLKSYGLI